MGIMRRLMTVILLVVLFTACNQQVVTVPTPTTPPTITIKTRQSEIRNPELVSYVVENCNGPSPIETNPGRSRSTTVEINLKLGGSIEFDAPVKAKLEAEFSVKDGETVVSNQDFKLKAEAGSRVTYEITWGETWQVGEADVNGITIPYEIRTGLKGDVGSGQPQLCPAALTAQAIPATLSPTLGTPVLATHTPSPTFVPPSVTSQPAATLAPPSSTPVPQTLALPLAPTDVPTPISPHPSSTESISANIQIHIFATHDSLTLYVSEAVSLMGFQFGVIVDGKLKIITLADRFDSLTLTGGHAKANDCYIYALADADPPLSQSCSGQVYRATIAPTDHFWYDTVRNQPRDLAIFRDGQITGIICSAATPDCAVDWAVIPLTSPTQLTATPFSTVTAQLSTITAVVSVTIRVPEGCFIMGDEDGMSDERPAHQVCLSEYYIDKYPVSWKELHDCVLAAQCAIPINPNYSLSTRSNYPATGLTWTEAQSYCIYRGGDLPTEAQWEYAARGNNPWIYPWGSSPPTDDYAVFGAVTGVQPVDSKLRGASWVGAVGMAGNVWQWVQDWYDPTYYHSADATKPDPKGPMGGKEKGLRGGAFDTLAEKLRSTGRFSAPYDNRDQNIGFRCAYSTLK